MVETLTRVLKHTSERDGKPAKAIIWAHNSHLGDARHTDMGIKKCKHFVVFM